MTETEKLAEFWKYIGYEKGTNRVVVNINNQQTYMDNFFLIQRDDGAYIYDKNKGRLYDNNLNYYHNGKYYSKNNEFIKEVIQTVESNIVKNDSNKAKSVKQYVDEQFEKSKYQKHWQKALESYKAEDYNFIRNTPDFYMAFDNKETGGIYGSVLRKTNDETIMGVVNEDSLLIYAHGSEDGKIAVGQGKKMTVEELGLHLQQNNLIPEHVKNIYTMNCYGGLQQPFVLENGVKIQSGHTSDKPIASMVNSAKTENIKLSFIGLQDNAEIIPELEKYQGKTFSLAFDTKAFFNENKVDITKEIDIDENGQYYIKDLKPESSDFYGIDNDGQLYIKDAKPESSVNKNATEEMTQSFIDKDGNIKEEYTSKEMTPSFIDKNGNIKDEYIISDEYTRNVEEYRQLILDRYKKYTEWLQKSAAVYNGSNYYQKDLIQIINNHGGPYGEDIRYEFSIPISKREKELLEYFKKQGITSHTENVTEDLGNGRYNTYNIEVDTTEDFVNEVIIDDKFREEMTNYASSEEFNNFYIDNHENLSSQETFDKNTEEIKKENEQLSEDAKKIKQEIKEINQTESIFARVSINQKGNIYGTDKIDFDNLTPEQQKEWEEILNEAKNKKAEWDRQHTPILEEKKWDSPKNDSILENINNSQMSQRNLTDASTDAINEGASKINMKKVGKIGIALAVVGIGAYVIGKSNNKKEKQNNQQQMPNYQTHVADTSQVSYDNSLLYNSYAQQMASDISSYRYGKQMTGFI